MFIAVLLIFTAAESLTPRRKRVFTRLARWPANLALVAIDSLMLRLLVPLLAVGVAVWAREHEFGLLHQLAWPGWAEFVLGILALDLIIYGQHIAFHKMPLLWRLHRVHHCDPDVDATTGLRFHPGEILISMGIKMGATAALGLGPATVIVFEIVLNATALFNHANLCLPGGADRVLRALIVTPDMHRVHHSQIRIETDSNFGFNISLWDRLFGTYRAQPRDGHDGMRLGLADQPPDQARRLTYLLGLPFRRRAAP